MAIAHNARKALRRLRATNLVPPTGRLDSGSTRVHSVQQGAIADMRRPAVIVIRWIQRVDHAIRCGPGTASAQWRSHEDPADRLDLLTTNSHTPWCSTLPTVIPSTPAVRRPRLRATRSTAIRRLRGSVTNPHSLRNT